MTKSEKIQFIMIGVIASYFAIRTIVTFTL